MQKITQVHFIKNYHISTIAHINRPQMLKQNAKDYVALTDKFS